MRRSGGDFATTEHLRSAVYPDGTVSWGKDGIRYSYRRSGSRILVFVDEKGGFHPTALDKKDAYPDMFLSLAIVIKEEDMPSFIEQFQAFKRQVRPDMHPEAWEIKGKGYRKADGQWTNQHDMVRTWTLFSSWLKETNVTWYVHATVSNKSATVLAHPHTDWEDKSTTHAFMRTNLAALLGNCIALRGMSPINTASPDYLTSPKHAVHDIEMFYDRLDDTKLEQDLARVFEWCFEQDDLLRGLTEMLNINLQFDQLGFGDHNSYFAGMEFTDMILYVIYNFLAGRDVARMTTDHSTALKYYQPMLHAIRHRIARSVNLGKQEVSSIVRVLDVIDYTFGKTLIDRLTNRLPNYFFVGV